MISCAGLVRPPTHTQTLASCISIILILILKLVGRKTDRRRGRFYTWLIQKKKRRKNGSIVFIYWQCFTKKKGYRDGKTMHVSPEAEVVVDACLWNPKSCGSSVLSGSFWIFSDPPTAETCIRLWQLPLKPRGGKVETEWRNGTLNHVFF